MERCILAGELEMKVNLANESSSRRQRCRRSNAKLSLAWEGFARYSYVMAETTIEPSENPRPHSPVILFLVVLVVVFGGALGVVCSQFAAGKQQAQRDLLASAEREARLAEEIAQLKDHLAARESEIAEREKDLAERERTITGREDAANERTQSSFQGLMIQQQLLRNLEALKASLPDMTPEVDKLAKEHAQLSAERERLQRENATLRQQLPQAPQPDAQK